MLFWWLSTGNWMDDDMVDEMSTLKDDDMIAIGALKFKGDFFASYSAYDAWLYGGKFCFIFVAPILSCLCFLCCSKVFPLRSHSLRPLSPSLLHSPPSSSYGYTITRVRT